jgi:hypothetical protein
MTQTRDNGIVVPINSDEYQLTQDLQVMADSANVVTVVADATALAALDKYEGRLAFRLDTAELVSVVGDAWRAGTLYYAPLSPAGWSSSGLIAVTAEGVKRRVSVDLTMSRTGGNTVIDAGSWSLLGTVLPAAAIGSSPVKYESIVVTGGGNHIAAAASFNPGGTVSIRSFGDFTYTTGALFTINVVYYI